MSVHHHDERYYGFLKRLKRRCIRPDCPNRAMQFHHMELIASKTYSGTIPRRHSTYQVVWVCHWCHRFIDQGNGGEKSWLGFFPNGLDDIYAEVFTALSQYRSLIVTQLQKAKVPVRPLALPDLDDLDGYKLRWQRIMARMFHDDLDRLVALCREKGV